MSSAPYVFGFASISFLHFLTFSSSLRALRLEGVVGYYGSISLVIGIRLTGLSLALSCV